MKSEKVLEMINNNKIEELKAMLQDEIYTETLKGKTGNKQRYSAMKRYQSSIGKYDNESFKRVGIDVEIQGEKYNSFIDGFSIVLTKEDAGELEKHDQEKHGEYFKINQMIPDLGMADGKLNYKEILADAKQRGYKYKKKTEDNKIVVKISNEHINMTLLEKAYSIIDDGKIPELFLTNDNGKSPVILKSSIGIALVLPIVVNTDNMNNFIIFEADIKK